MGDTQHDFSVTFPEAFGRSLRVAARILGDGATAEDVAAEALARAYARWDEIGHCGYTEAWICRVTSNLALDMLKRRKPEMRWLQATVVHRGSHLSTEDEAASRLVVATAIARLPSRQREVVALRLLADFSEDDAARAMRVSIGTVKRHLKRAKASLRLHLGHDLGAVHAHS